MPPRALPRPVHRCAGRHFFPDMGLEIRYLPIGILSAYDRNPKTHPEEQIERNRLGAVAACA